MAQPPSYDVAIIGAGTAGTATALAIGSQLRVVMIEADVTVRARIGESLPGAASLLLRDLGVLDRFLAAGHLASLGRASCWGSSKLDIADGFRDPQGSGWRLDRVRFETDLRAAAAGTAWLLHGQVTDIARTPGKDWRLSVNCADGPEQVEARFLVDAGGRAARVARIAGAKREAEDRLICRYVVVPRGAASVLDGFSFVEAVPEGWWYAAVLPGERQLIAFHTDADLPAARQSASLAGFARLVSQSAQLSSFTDRLAGETPDILRVSARSGGLRDPAGPGWAAAGDAALCFDPLSSQGLFHALYCGLKLGGAMVAELAGDPSPMAGYASGIKEIAAQQRRQRLAAYRAETRFGDAAFWQRRLREPDHNQGMAGLAGTFTRRIDMD